MRSFSPSPTAGLQEIVEGPSYCVNAPIEVEISPRTFSIFFLSHSLGLTYEAFYQQLGLLANAQILDPLYASVSSLCKYFSKITEFIILKL